MKKDIERILVTEEELAAKVAEIGAKITADYAGKDLLLVSVLKGSVVFMADLMRAINLPIEIDFMAVSSYGSGVKTSGVVKILKDLDVDVSGRHILLVEDILDSGMTLQYIMEMLSQRGAADIKICTLLDKPERRKVNVQADYFGFVIPDKFVVGYGLDYNETYRNIPFVGVLKPEIYS